MSARQPLPRQRHKRLQPLEPPEMRGPAHRKTFGHQLLQSIFHAHPSSDCSKLTLKPFEGVGRRCYYLLSDPPTTPVPWCSSCTRY